MINERALNEELVRFCLHFAPAESAFAVSARSLEIYELLIACDRRFDYNLSVLIIFAC